MEVSNSLTIYELIKYIIYDYYDVNGFYKFLFHLKQVLNCKSLQLFILRYSHIPICATSGP